MLAKIQYQSAELAIDFSKPLDISIGLRGDDKNPVAWYLKHPEISPVRDGNFIGKVSEGASVNFNNIWFGMVRNKVH